MPYLGARVLEAQFLNVEQVSLHAQYANSCCCTTLLFDNSRIIHSGVGSKEY